VRPQAIMYSAALKLFLEEKTKSRRASTVEDLTDRLSRHFPFKGQVADITHQEIGRRLSKIKTSSEHDHALAVAKTFFTWAHNRRYITDNPVRGLSPHGHTSRARVLTNDEINAVWKGTDQMEGHFSTIVKLLILTGQRRTKISSLQFSWIKNDHIVFPKDICKNGKEHTFPIGLLASQLLASTSTSSSASILFPARGKDTPFNGWSKSKAVLDALSGIADWTLHDLRRTFATRLAEMGVAPHVIERLLNHVTGSLSPIALVYNKAKYLEEMREAVEKWEAYLAKTMN
jgi:integrase